MEEYICRTASPSEWQKWLNQWRHNYNLKIIATESTPNGIFMVILRTKK